MSVPEGLDSRRSSHPNVLHFSSFCLSRASLARSSLILFPTHGLPFLPNKRASLPWSFSSWLLPEAKSSIQVGESMGYPTICIPTRMGEVFSSSVTQLDLSPPPSFLFISFLPCLFSSCLFKWFSLLPLFLSLPTCLLTPLTSYD